MISKNRLAFAAISAGLITSLVGIGAAQADPTDGVYHALNGVGSDTTQGVMNQIAADTGGFASWDATPSPSTFDTLNPNGNCGAVNRPNGSGAGHDALLASLAANDGCLQFSRSSSLNTAKVSPQLVYIPFAIDAVSYAITSDSNLSRTFDLATLKRIYTCDPALVGTTSPYKITPILPQAGSGTRSYWEGQMGIADADVNAGVKYPCIINGTKNGVTIEEHTGTALDKKSIEPFSIGQYNSQANGTLPDRRGKAVLGTIGTTIPQLTNDSFSIQREVYNVIPVSKETDSTYSSLFVGANSSICKDSATIQAYGFALDKNCGVTTNVTTP